jgi:iron complex transport system permease protein
LLAICGILAGTLVVICLVSLSLGAVSIPVWQVLTAIVKRLVGAQSSIPSEYRLILFEIRGPRILLGMMVGAALAVAGGSFQALLRNPLADPYVLGVSSGAALGAIVTLIIGRAAEPFLPLAAFLGAAATIAVVFWLGQKGGQLESHTLLLAGVITASFLSAVIMFLMTTLSGRELRGAAFWLMGDLSTPSPPWLLWLFGLLLIGAVGFVYGVAADLNVLLAGEREASHLGVDVARTKLVVYLCASLITGLAVSVSGSIGYVGLLVPHLVRLLFSSDYRVLIPASALMGAMLIVLADTLSRTVVAPTELPVGAVTAIAGAPVFIYLLRKRSVG